MKISYIALSIPIFFLLIGIELAFSFWKKRKLYRFNDALTNISLGIGQQVIGVLMKSALGFGYLFLYEYARILTLENTYLTIFLLFLGVDFFYYWFHRMGHEINFLWAAHIVHHQSEDYNLTVALRQSWIQSWFSWIFYLPLAIIGFDPDTFFIMASFNTLYQFWIHTTTIKSLGPLEWVLSTPSHHRVHHGSNPKYIDRNHAGSLIIWDRMFGTFFKEEEEPTYGITKPLNSWNPIWANVHYWKELWELSKRCKGFDKILAFIKPPGWQPDYLGGFQAPPEIDLKAYSKYDNDSLKQDHLYTFLVFLIALCVATAILFAKDHIPDIPLLATSFYVFATLLTFGGLMEKKAWVIPAEFGRIIAGLIVALLFWETPFFNQIMRYSAIFSLVNLILFNKVAKHIQHGRSTIA